MKALLLAHTKKRISGIAACIPLEPFADLVSSSVRCGGEASWLRVKQSPSCSGKMSLSPWFLIIRIKTAEMLTQAGIPSTVVLDSAIAYVMDKVDMVLVGSEAVVESGGLINAVGSNQIAIIAKAANKPFYALAERCTLSVSFSINLRTWYHSATNFIVFSHCLNTTFPAIFLVFFPFLSQNSVPKYP
jgi:hypothetical protein